ncbi:MAG: hypothetical protein DWQ09_00745 [Proteobacteria bacterium]|nr:MAG: hypothetical protein DWQ09_00745 [Pseudomonadota bacterium]
MDVIGQSVGWLIFIPFVPFFLFLKQLSFNHYNGKDNRTDIRTSTKHPYLFFLRLFPFIKLGYSSQCSF